MAKSARWLILELNEAIENIEYKEIETVIRGVFGNKVDYFIPIHYERVGSYESTSILIEGYVFIRDSIEVRHNLNNILESRLFSSVLISSDRYQTVTSSQIKSLKKSLKESLKRRFTIGCKVLVLGGVFKNLVGEVISNGDGKNVIIKIQRLSREIIAPIPSTLLKEVKNEVFNS